MRIPKIISRERTRIHIDTAMQPKYVSIQRNDIWLQRMF